ncbi:MAG: hypothetical protein K6G85_04680 [Eubacterium sp.]|nr:hypothetical protein [Eubacterium sp.]
MIKKLVSILLCVALAISVQSVLPLAKNKHKIMSDAHENGVKFILLSDNLPAAIIAVLGDGNMPGELPINIPSLEKNINGEWNYTDTILYKRGFRLRES